MKRKIKPTPRKSPAEYAPSTDRVTNTSGLGARKPLPPLRDSALIPVKKRLKESAPFLDLCVDLLNSVEDLKTRVAILETERAATQPTRRRT